jgi:hypothetical protein
MEAAKNCFRLQSLCYYWAAFVCRVNTYSHGYGTNMFEQQAAEHS